MFMDFGPEMANLLSQQAAKNSDSDYIKRLQQAYRKEGIDTPVEPVAVSETNTGVKVLGLLTNREQEILELFSQRLSNQEIADSLYIAPSTVKRHTANIYRKLDVNSRREVVSKAAGMGIISPN